MDIGIPKETFMGEDRLALSPLAVKTLVEHGHTVYVESGAGLASNFHDSEFTGAGATVVYSHDEAFGRARLVPKVQRPGPAELDMLPDGQILFSFLHLATARDEHVRTLLERNITAIGYEIIEDEEGSHPLVRSFSEIAGRMCMQVAARCLEVQSGGRGILLGGAPGVPPAEVVIIGAGNLGRSAAEAALGLGARVTLLDTNVNQLRSATRHIRCPIVTATATTSHIEAALSYADVLVMAVGVRHGARAPMIIRQEMVRRMRSGSVIIDTAIDQGGSVETSRPTSIDNPIFMTEGVVHYCVPNMTASVPRTGSRVLSNASLPYVLEIADEGLEHVLRNHQPLARAAYTHAGRCCNTEIAELFGLEYTPLDELIK
jgi:alanine dehydrogenase